jgi:hypothetical protein
MTVKLDFEPVATVKEEVVEAATEEVTETPDAE